MKWRWLFCAVAGPGAGTAIDECAGRCLAALCGFDDDSQCIADAWAVCVVKRLGKDVADVLVLPTVVADVSVHGRKQGFGGDWLGVNSMDELLLQCHFCVFLLLCQVIGLAQSGLMALKVCCQCPVFVEGCVCRHVFPLVLKYQFSKY